MGKEFRLGATSELPSGKVAGAGPYAVGNREGEYFAVTRRCRHLGADLANGSIDADGFLVCTLHQSKDDFHNGRMVRGPQWIFARMPGHGGYYKALTRAMPLGRGEVTERAGDLYVR
jgi:nitrite reductase/ring-hydroxylating ferredoxin subunit